MEIRPILSTLLKSRTGPLLVAVQVAISLAILANAIFIVQQRIAVSERPSGVADERNTGRVAVSPLRKLSHPEILAEQQRQAALLRGIAGVKSVASTNQMPLSRSGSSSGVRGDPMSNRETAQAAHYYVQPGFIATLGLRLVDGRDFTDTDVVEADVDKDPEPIPQAAIVTQSLARALFPNESRFVGRTFYFGSTGQDQPTRIIGVVERLQTTGAQSGEAGEYSVMLPARISTPGSRFAIRSEPGQIDRVLKEAAETLRKTSPVPVRTATRTVAEDRIARYRNEKALAWMLIAVSALLLLVTASGIVGMTALRVAQRRKQIGVRRALGARWRDILRYFVTENIIITTGGIVAGLLLALGLNRMLIALVGVPRLPLEYLAMGAGALWMLGIAAVYGPAARAASISPAIATRTA